MIPLLILLILEFYRYENFSSEWYISIKKEQSPPYYPATLSLPPPPSYTQQNF